MTFGIQENYLKDIISEIKKNLGAAKEPKLFIYGSRAKDKHQEFSDIDLLLYAKIYDETSLNCIDFEKLNIPYKIDFVLEKYIFEAYKVDIINHRKEVSLTQ